MLYEVITVPVTQRLADELRTTRGLLREALPGCTIEPLHLGVQTRDGRVLSAGVAARWYDETEFLQTSGLPLTAAQLEARLDIHMISYNFV